MIKNQDKGRANFCSFLLMRLECIRPEGTRGQNSRSKLFSFFRVYPYRLGFIFILYVRLDFIEVYVLLV